MRYLLVVATTLALSHGEASAQPTAATITQSEAEVLGRLYADAINSPEGVDAYLKRDVEQVPQPAIRNFFADQRWINGGGVEFLGARIIRPGGSARIEVAVRGRLYGAVQGVVISVDDKPQPNVTFFEPVPAPEWAVHPPPRRSPDQIARRVRAAMQKGCAAGLFSGAVLLAADEKVLVNQACGEASRRYHVANLTTTRFNLGSIDKMFTAVSVMQLAEQGRLSLDATLDHYLDASWIEPAIARRITLWQLMSHTSGLQPDFVDLAMGQPRTRFRELDEYKRLSKDLHLSFAPGTQFEYSNTGMILLGAVVAKVSGQDYYAYVREHIFAPSGMTSTGAFATDDPVENLAFGYVPDSSFEKGWSENTNDLLLRGIPAGGGYSTTMDMLRFASALNAGKLVSRASLEKLWADPDAHNYGGGFETGCGAVGRTVGHSGFFPGVSTRLRIYRDRGYVLVVLSNMFRAAPPLIDAIDEELLAAPLAIGSACA